MGATISRSNIQRSTSFSRVSSQGGISVTPSGAVSCVMIAMSMLPHQPPHPSTAPAYPAGVAVYKRCRMLSARLRYGGDEPIGELLDVFHHDPHRTNARQPDGSNEWRFTVLAACTCGFGCRYSPAQN